MDYNRQGGDDGEEEGFGADPSFDADDILNSAVDETPDVLGNNWEEPENGDMTELAENGGENDPFEDENPPEYSDEDGGEIKDDISDDIMDEAGEDGEYPDADSYDQDDLDETMESNGEDEATDEDIEKFVAVEKKSYEEASQKKPGRLNKKIILNTVVILGASLFLFTLFMPESCKQRKNRDAKKNGPATDVTLQDFRGMASTSDKSKGRDARPKGKKKPPVLGADGHWYDEDGNIVDDEVEAGVYGDIAEIEVAEEKPKPAQEVQQTASYGYAAEERPDTRGDALQAGISGIKGLTGTRANYMTDYEQTREENSRYTGLASAGGATAIPSAEEYQNMMLSAVRAQTGGSSYKEQNDQAGKTSFHTEGRENAGQGEWRPKNSLWEGTIFEAELMTALNTDLPGEITARVTQNIYSSQTGEYLLIPQNSILYGTYNSSISYSQSRVQIAWNKIIRPDGYVINLGNFNAVDKKGAAGVRGFVNDHPLAYLKAIAVMSVFNIVSREFETSIDSSKNEYAQNVLANSQEIANTLGEKLIDRAMDVQPTITKPAGTILYVLTNQPLQLPPVEMPPVVVPYQRKHGWQ